MEALGLRRLVPVQDGEGDVTDSDLTLADVTTDYPRVPVRCEQCDREFVACWPEETRCEECEAKGVP